MKEGAKTMYRLIAIAFFPILCAGCVSTGMYGRKVSGDFAREWDCSPTFIEREYERSQASLEKGHAYLPQVGWDICTLLSRVGQPHSRSEMIRSTYSSSITFYYRIPRKDLFDADRIGRVYLQKDNPLSRHVQYKDWTVIMVSGFE